MKDQAIEVATTVGSKTTFAGASMTWLGWLASNEVLGVIGAAVAIAGLAVTWYYKAEANRRQQSEHELRMSLLRSGAVNPDRRHVPREVVEDEAE